jgi:hypothetical protein
MNSANTVKNILEICNRTSELDGNKDPNAEAQRLDDVITQIMDLCDNCINDPDNENELNDE